MSAGPRDLTVGDEARRIRDAATVFRALVPAVEEWCATLPQGVEPGFVGCGSSLDVPEALVDAAGRGRAVSASEFVPDPEVTWVALSRSGSTRELLPVMESGAVEHVVTCSPNSPVARRARHVLDLSPAADSGFVAALSALVTAGAVALTLGDDPRDVAEALTPGSDAAGSLRGTSAVAWLGPWRAYPLGRELARKCIETGRRSSYAHQFEFLHGDDQMYPRGSAWVALGGPADNAALLDLVDDARREQVVALDVGWEQITPADVVALLARTYQMVFSGE